MTGTNSSNDRVILRQNVEINSDEYFSYDIFSGMKSSTTWNGNAIAQSSRKFRDFSNTCNIQFIMVYRTIIDVILHLFIRCQLPFLKKKLSIIMEALFSVTCLRCVVTRGCPDVNKHRGMDTAILRQHLPFTLITSFVQHSAAGDKRWCPYAH